MLIPARARRSTRALSLPAALATLVALLPVPASRARQAPGESPYVGQLRATEEERDRAARTFLEDLGRLRPRAERLATEPGPGVGLHRPLEEPEAVRSEGGLLRHDLVVSYGENPLYNPKEGRPVTVRLRSYNGRLFGQTLRARPGDQLHVRVDNRLPEEPGHRGDLNVPHRFNTTNLHTHGLHVSPAGNSDNVLLALPPGSTFRYEIQIPADHAPGTFWYHAHVHGSTAIQTTSGMAGALIIEGGLDDAPSIRDAVDRVLIFQQMPYVPSPGPEGSHEIESYDHFGPREWAAGVADRGWRTTINGQTQPTILLRPGEVQRWRMIHAAFRESIDVRILPLDEAASMMRPGLDLDLGDEDAPEARSAPTSMRAVERRREQADRDSLGLHEIAADGLAYGFAWTRPSVELQPGYRSDVLVKIDRPGTYVLMDGEMSAERSLWRRYEGPRVLGVVEVAGDPLDMPLPTNDELAGSRPHPSIGDAEVVGCEAGSPARKRLQKVEFNIDLDFTPPLFQINSQSYDPRAMPRTLGLGKAYEWILTSRFVNHPFHIHVNPFEVIQWNDEEGRSLLPIIDGERRTIWKDTILVRENPGGSEARKIRVRARNERYIGRFVLHCHILDHEDQGMMQDVEIIPPGSAHHH